MRTDLGGVALMMASAGVDAVQGGTPRNLGGTLSFAKALGDGVATLVADSLGGRAASRDQVKLTGALAV